MITLSRRDLGPYRLTAFRQHTTSRGIYWAGRLTCQGSTIGVIENRGDGGATVINIDDPLARSAFHTFLIALRPQLDPIDPKTPMPPATELWAWEENFALWLSDEAELVRRIKRQIKRAIVFALTSDPPLTTRALRLPYSPARAEHLRAQAGDRLAWIANEVMDRVL